MPEIWLGYGESEVILDIKYENILKNIKSEYSLMDSGSIERELDTKIDLKESTLVLIFNPFYQMTSILEFINKKWKNSGFNNIEFDIVSKNIPSKYKKDLIERGIVINKIDENDISNRISKFENLVILAKIEYDPMFGYNEISNNIIKSCYANEMNQAYSFIIDKLPQPGISGEALKFSNETLKRKLNFQPIYVIANNQGINSIYCGDIEKSFYEAIEQFNKISQPTIERSKTVFLSGNSNFNIQSTLSNSLNLLWNNYHTVKENGTIILLSENRFGIGNGALMYFIEGRLDQGGMNKYQYVKDIEHINFLNLLKDKYDIYLISTVPAIYLEKLGLKTITKIKEGLDKTIAKYGKYSKSTIISNSELIHGKII